MPILVTSGTTVKELPYLPTMCMGSYLRYVIAPAFELQCRDGVTVLAKVHTFDLRVVFNNECRGRALKDFLIDNGCLFISAWDDDDASTCRSLVGNVNVISAESKSVQPGQ